MISGIRTRTGIPSFDPAFHPEASELLIEAARLPDCPTYVSTEEAEEDPLQDCSLSTLWRSLVQSSIVNLGHRKSALRKLSIHVSPARVS